MADVIPEGFFDNPKQDAKVSSILTINTEHFIDNVNIKTLCTCNFHQILINKNFFLYNI